ncbi:uncharacterized protein LOC120271532 [Dioscorea cayenensis subsp. rotundata]|uniref:Uncharacterized protein LOC120271532 n=1 Tax=Dioscorea cayennensis subsp. rotundata TaxID=55577 RepID=A0AB40C323_DIOCR|nr:uncharacterized protein LOC120271532 [Dioscorea cayenensis subsp. rotundata]
MAPYEALYGRRCRSPICWDNVGERKLLGPEIVQITVEKVRQIRDRLQEAQSQQKSYADNRRRSLEFLVGEHVFLKVAPTKGIPFRNLGPIGEVAYRLALPPALSRVHNVFHVFMLRKYVSNPNHVIQFLGFELNSDLSYKEQPVKIVDFKKQELRKRVIPYVKVQWKNHYVHEETWELESEMREKYPFLFLRPSASLED